MSPNKLPPPSRVCTLVPMQGAKHTNTGAEVTMDGEEHGVSSRTELRYTLTPSSSSSPASRWAAGTKSKDVTRGQGHGESTSERQR